MHQSLSLILPLCSTIRETFDRLIANSLISKGGKEREGLAIRQITSFVEKISREGSNNLIDTKIMTMNYVST